MKEVKRMIKAYRGSPNWSIRHRRCGI